MDKEKPPASFSLDLDNLWTYLKIKGDPRWQEYPSYLEFFIPYILNVLEKFKLSITFFIVGKDAAEDQNKDLLKEIVSKGHEVANHTFSHEPWMHEYNQIRLEEEIIQAEEIIYEVTNRRTIGFRGPGFTWNRALLEILSNRGYLYDSSTLPTYIAPLARTYYFFISKLKGEAREKRGKLFGSMSEGFRSIDPYLWELSDQKNILEIPVTTVPFFRVPFHLSYLMYLCTFSSTAMHGYIKCALELCRLASVSPNFLLHPTDFMDATQVPEMAFFPGMTFSHQKKLEEFGYIIESFSRHFRFTNMSSYAHEILKSPAYLKKKKT